MLRGLKTFKAQEIIDLFGRVDLTACIAIGAEVFRSKGSAHRCAGHRQVLGCSGKDLLRPFSKNPPIGSCAKMPAAAGKEGERSCSQIAHLEGAAPDTDEAGALTTFSSFIPDFRGLLDPDLLSPPGRFHLIRGMPYELQNLF